LSQILWGLLQRLSDKTNGRQLLDWAWIWLKAAKSAAKNRVANSCQDGSACSAEKIVRWKYFAACNTYFLRFFVHEIKNFVRKGYKCVLKLVSFERKKKLN
jgi:hypothetical protein